jgi:hypothetical protein
MTSKWKMAMFLLALSVSLVRNVDAQTLTTGCWQINANGFDSGRGTNSQLCITSVTPAGAFSGTQGSRTVQGFWNQATARITFLTFDTAAPANSSRYQFYSGCWFADDHRNPTGLKRLTGTFIAFAGTGGAPNRFEYGWTATRF